MAANFLVPLLIPLGEQLANANMDPATIFKIITNSTWIVTQLMTGESVRFSQERYLVEVSEGAPSGTLLVLQASTPDAESPLQYKLSKDSDSNLFKVDHITGALYLIAPLDYEIKTLHEVKVVASTTAGREGSSEAIVSVKVLDANDHAPYFDLRRHETQITEENDHNLPKPVFQVQARDGDAGLWGELCYSLAGDGVYKNDIELCSEQNIRKTQFSSSKNMDNSNQSSKLSGFNNSKLQSPHDSYKNEIMKKSENSVFVVDRHTGTISITKALDRDPPDGRSIWRLVVTATDGELQADTTVVINVKDINDNPPVFSTPNIEATVTENSPKGTYVVTVTAEDADDINEGNNAKLTYSLQKNAVDEDTGQPVFEVDPQLGVISTAMCCLDRERASQYGLTLVAIDGGGLQGSCEVTVQVADENDVPPRWGRPEWTVEVAEGKPPDEILATLTVKDPDTHNKLAFRVSPNSGRGWNLIGITGRPDSGIAELRSLTTLDRENVEHRDGFKFQVQVTDQGSNQWDNKYRVGVAYVNVKIIDVNDNSPIFLNNNVTVSLKEDTPLGAIVANVKAEDQDEGRNGLVSYEVHPDSDPNKHFGINTEGDVRITRQLDRESSKKHNVRIIAKDHGNPYRESKCNLTVWVEDVNDNSPTLSIPTYIKVHKDKFNNFKENFYLKDPDEWSLGHGPPFHANLDVRSPRGIRNAVKISFKTNSGNGEGTIRVIGSLLRDESSSIVIPIVTSDSGSPPLTGTVSVTIALVSEDSPTASKEIDVFVLQPMTHLGNYIPIGPLSVNSERGTEYSWSKHNVNFQLNKATGRMNIKSSAPDNKYELEVALHTPSKVAIHTSLTVRLRHIPKHYASHSVPVDVMISPTQLIDTTQTGSSTLFLLKDALSILSFQARNGVHLNLTSAVEGKDLGERLSSSELIEIISIEEISTTGGDDKISRLWIMTSSKHPVEFLFSHNKMEIENYIGTGILGVGMNAAIRKGCNKQCDCCCSPRVTINDNYSITKSNSMNVIGPSLEMEENCKCINVNKNFYETKDSSAETLENKLTLNSKESKSIIITSDGMRELNAEPPFADARRNRRINGKMLECNERTCYNGGRCLPSPPGFKCICPSGSHGPRCKFITRHFEGDRDGYGSWAWLSPLNPCSKLHLSLNVLTSTSNGTIFSSIKSSSEKIVGFSLKLINGEPMFTLNIGSGSVILHNKVRVDDSKWHRIDITWKNKTVEVIVDHCISTRDGDDSSRKRCKVSTNSPDLSGQLNTGGSPFQLGYNPMDESESGSGNFKGCFKLFRINGEIQDLGENLMSHSSTIGCKLVNCQKLDCSPNSVCKGSPGDEFCDCLSGYSGKFCDQKTVPASFSSNSFLQIALLFSLPTEQNSIYLRLRTRQSNGLIIALRYSSGEDHLLLNIRSGRPCLTLHQQHAEKSSVCLSENLHDGIWHTLQANRYGSLLELTMDDGDSHLHAMSTEKIMPWNYNRVTLFNTSNSKSARSVPERPVLHTNFKEGCLDDIRISGITIPLPPMVNHTDISSIEAAMHMEAGCSSTPSCANATCPNPFVCHDHWKKFKCDCLDGYEFTADSLKCSDIDECIYEPCLNSAGCINLKPGYKCECLPGFGGSNCESLTSSTSFTPISLVLIISIFLTLTILIGGCLIATSYILLVRRKKMKNRSDESEKNSSTGENEMYNFYSGRNFKSNSSKTQICNSSSFNVTKPNDNSNSCSMNSNASNSSEGLHRMEVHYTTRSSTHTSLAPSLLELRIGPLEHQPHPSVTGLSVLSVDADSDSVAKSAATIRAPKGYRDDEDSRSDGSCGRGLTGGLSTSMEQIPWPLLKSCSSSYCSKDSIISKHSTLPHQTKCSMSQDRKPKLMSPSQGNSSTQISRNGSGSIIDSDFCCKLPMNYKVNNSQKSSTLSSFVNTKSNKDFLR